MGRRRPSSTERRNLEGRYAFTPAAAVFDNRLNRTDLVVLVLMGTYATPDRPAFPYATDLAKTLGINADTVRRSIKRLESCKYLTRTTYNGRNAWSMATAAADCHDLPDELRRSTPWLDHDPIPDTQTGNRPNSRHPDRELGQNTTPRPGINGSTQFPTTELPKPDVSEANSRHPDRESWGYGDEWGYPEKEEQEERGEHTTPRPPPKDENEAANRIKAGLGTSPEVCELIGERSDEWPYKWTAEAWEAECRLFRDRFPDLTRVAS